MYCIWTLNPFQSPKAKLQHLFTSQGIEVFATLNLLQLSSNNKKRTAHSLIECPIKAGRAGTRWNDRGIRIRGSRHSLGLQLPSHPHTRRRRRSPSGGIREERATDTLKPRTPDGQWSGLDWDSER